MIAVAPNSYPRSRDPRSNRAVTGVMVFGLALAASVHAGKVRITGVDYLGDLPTRIADRDGLFEAEGVEALVAYNASGHDNLQALRAGIRISP